MNKSRLMKINYIFRYHNSSNLIYLGSKDDFEEQIAQKLLPIEEQSKIQIDAVNMNFDFNQTHDQKYSLEVILDSPDAEYTHIEKEKDPQSMVHKSLDSLLQFIRKEKDKKTH
ncbi:MAG: hypothetical protein ACRCXZ_05335 [Patescibacteria group bacterium]